MLFRLVEVKLVGRIPALVVLVLGLWIFLAPFLGPVVGLYLSPPPMRMGGMPMRMGMTTAITINRAMVFVDFIPGVVLSVIGVYYLFRRPAAEAV
jgi:hypothetical protein